MDVQGEKKAWKRPQLTVLVRIDMAEAVLLTCKRSDANSSGAGGQYWRCYNTFGFPCAGACSVQRPS